MQKTAYEMRISDWSSDVCSSDLSAPARCGCAWTATSGSKRAVFSWLGMVEILTSARQAAAKRPILGQGGCLTMAAPRKRCVRLRKAPAPGAAMHGQPATPARSEDNTSELKSQMRISYAVIC